MMPASVEQAYHRGFTQAAELATHAIEEGVTVREVLEWVYGPVWKWRYCDPMRFGIVPEPPRVDGAK